MDPNQPRRMKVKSTTARTKKGKRIAGSDSQPPQPPKQAWSTPSSAPSVPQQAPQLRNDLQRFRYDLFQGSKYNSGRQVEWSVYAQANFYIEVKKFIKDMSWMG